MGKDPYKYFRVEARELLEGLGNGVLELEKGAPGADVLPRLLRFAHTLKGAARVVRQPEIAELCHAVEDALGAAREGPMSRAAADALLRLLDAMTARVVALGPAGEPAGPAPPPVPIVAQDPAPGAPLAPAAKPRPLIADEPMETVRVDVGDLDALLRGAAEAGARVAGLRDEVGAVAEMRRAAAALVELHARRGRAADGAAGAGSERGRALADELQDGLERLERGALGEMERLQREIAAVRDTASRLRLLPASVLFGPLERAARDAASSMGRLVAFEAGGGESRLDAHVLDALRGALVHVVRNAVAHGGEPEAARRALGKPPALRVALRVERRGNRVAFVCADDGRGIDVEAVRQAAVQRGTIGASEAAAMSDAAALRLVLEGGLTTTGVVTEVAGRGIGLDVVRETADRLRGEVSIRSERGRGTSIEVCVPISLSSLAALSVEAGGVTASIPLDAVRRALRVTPADLARTATGEAIVYEAEPIPFLSLARALGPQGSALASQKGGGAVRPIVVVESGGARAAIGVDRILGTANVVLRPLGAALGALPIVAGVALDAYGDPELVLDPEGLVRAAQGARAPEREAPPAPRRPLLVVDDSLTTRMLEQSILESAGYEVDVATSAEEALVAAQARRYGLFVVDVEMPGMDGFEFVARTRADPILQGTPAILVTSRGSPEDKRRGEAAGARAYIVKGELDQVRLLATVRELAG